MNARLAKEIRLHRSPVVLSVLAAVVLSTVLDGHDSSGFVVSLYVGFCALIAATTFGTEYDSRTLLMLLSQPISRRELWFRKMSVLGPALLLCYGATLLSIIFISRGEAHLEDIRGLAAEMFVVAAITFCSAPFLALATKNLTGAVPLTIFLPLATAGGFFFLCWAGSYLTSHPDTPIFQEQFEKHPYRSIGIPALIYCALFYWLGYRSFMKLQAIDSQAQELKLPTAIEEALGRPLKKILPGYTSPTASLIRKELQIQRVAYLGAAFITLLLAGESVVWLLHPSEATSILMAVELLIYVLAVPVITGIVSTAEERNWGTAGWQLTLPVAPFKQWKIKIQIALVTLVMLGIVLPLVLLYLGKHIVGLPVSLPGGSTIEDLARNFTVAFVYLSLFALIVFASSVSNSSIRALTFVGGLLVAIGVTIGLESLAISYTTQHWPSLNPVLIPQIHDSVQLWAGYFGERGDILMINVVFITGSLCFIFMQSLAGAFSFKNFRSGELDARRNWTQTAVLLVSVAVSAFVLNGLIFLTNNLQF